MSRPTRLSADERRQKILLAAREAFSRKGLEGTRTAELARSAGVSERLLYKHFPSKKALYEAALKSYLDEVVFARSGVLELEPSTSTLVLLTYFLVSRFLEHSLELQSFLRIGARSLAEDGSFARFAQQQGLNPIMDKLQRCIETAMDTGDIPKDTNPVPVGLFIEALVIGVAHALLPAPPVLDFELERPQLIENLVWSALRGINLDDRIIARYYNPKALALLSR
jgi:AcrR family transcriptional regulator